ncbi:hypothetical protein FGG08_005556 [Glutinoglossum americanum]|uniref:Uncharacterized protein n=1 Tax=Glutinoglossum americanum TaxID=1670608 RepID=A0A9P8HY86_9PEZI|nr:hypothetical protein FGG08_005556 [Glutinoglossum americanum]
MLMGIIGEGRDMSYNPFAPHTTRPAGEAGNLIDPLGFDELDEMWRLEHARGGRTLEEELRLREELVQEREQEQEVWGGSEWQLGELAVVGGEGVLEFQSYGAMLGSVWHYSGEGVAILDPICDPSPYGSRSPANDSWIEGISDESPSVEPGREIMVGPGSPSMASASGGSGVGLQFEIMMIDGEGNPTEFECSREVFAIPDTANDPNRTRDAWNESEIEDMSCEGFTGVEPDGGAMAVCSLLSMPSTSGEDIVEPEYQGEGFTMEYLLYDLDLPSLNTPPSSREDTVEFEFAGELFAIPNLGYNLNPYRIRGASNYPKSQETSEENPGIGRDRHSTTRSGSPSKLPISKQSSARGPNAC